MYMDPSSRSQLLQDNMASHQTLESMLVCTKAAQTQIITDHKKPRPADQQALKCPRCDSPNTKFCYYNNYSLTQPRYFCKSCRRYWTKGGTLRNVPVGGGCRKNKRSASSEPSLSPSLSSKLIRPAAQDQQHDNPFVTATTINHHNNNHIFSYDHHHSSSTDLSLAFARLQNGQLGFDHHNHFSSFLGTNTNNAHAFLESSNTLMNGLQNVYYGDYMGNVENNVGGISSVNVSEEMGNLPYEDLMSSGVSSGGATTTAVTVTTVKDEGRNGGGREESGRVLWGYPWQNVGDHVDVGRSQSSSSWINGLVGNSTNWHGLINSTPLM